MTEGDEIIKAFCSFLAQVAEREKVKAIQKDDYSTALIATGFEGLFREGEKSIK